MSIRHFRDTLHERFYVQPVSPLVITYHPSLRKVERNSPIKLNPGNEINHFLHGLYNRYQARLIFIEVLARFFFSRFIFEEGRLATFHRNIRACQQWT